jgi:cell division protease FtsH
LPTLKHIAIAVAVIVVGFMMFNLFSPPPIANSRTTEPYSAFVASLDRGALTSVTIRGVDVTYKRTVGGDARSVIPSVAMVPALVDKLIAKNIVVEARDTSFDDISPSMLGLAVSWLPALLFWGFLWFAFAQPLMRLTDQLQAQTAAIIRFMEDRGKS